MDLDKIHDTVNAHGIASREELKDIKAKLEKLLADKA